MVNGNRLFRKLLLLLALAGPWQSAFAVPVTVMVDRDPVNINESFQIIFESDNSVGDPDFSPLNGDFRILGKSRQSSINIINGDMKRSNKWVLTVMANRTGELNIPVIHFGKARSEPSRVMVKKSGAGSGSSVSSDDVFIEVEAKPVNPYVQAQVIYTLKLYRAVETGNASLSDPEVSTGDAVIKKLGDDKEYEIHKDGKQYLVTELGM